MYSSSFLELILLILLEDKDGYILTWYLLRVSDMVVDEVDLNPS